MINRELFLTTLSHCVFVEGASRGLVCDLQKQVFNIIPRDLASLVLNCNGHRVDWIYKKYGLQNREILDEYFEFISANHYVFFTAHSHDVARFPELNVTGKKYDTIDNAIIDVDENSGFDILEVIDELLSVDCKYLQVRYFKMITTEEFLAVVKQVDETELVNIEFVVPYDDLFFKADLEKIFLLHQRLGTLIVYNSPFTKWVCYHEGVFKISYIQENISSHLHCGVVHPSWFLSSSPLYVASKTSNSCLYKKISIDSRGNIKNCPSMQESFGNIQNTSLKVALEKEGLKKHWYTTKDQVTVCADCEFRYVCTDCRAYLQDPGDPLSKPLKCGYDPFTATWEEWATNPLSKKGIEYYGLQ